MWRVRQVVATLLAMADTKSSAPAPAPAQVPYAPKWDPDPLVLCSRRSRVIPFPTALLLRAPTAAELAAIDAPPEAGKVRDESYLTVLAGVNFLGTWTTAWDPGLHRAASSQAAPRGAPANDRCILVAPYSRNAVLERRAGFVDRETGILMPEAVHAAWLRVLEWLRGRERAQVEGPAGQANVPLFLPEPGFDAPEFVLCRVSEVLSQRTQDGSHGYAHVHAAVEYTKDGAHLGALHDYAARTTTGWSLALACRARAVRAPSLVQRTA